MKIHRKCTTFNVLHRKLYTFDEASSKVPPTRSLCLVASLGSVCFCDGDGSDSDFGMGGGDNECGGGKGGGNDSDVNGYGCAMISGGILLSLFRSLALARALREKECMLGRAGGEESGAVIAPMDGSSGCGESCADGEDCAKDGVKVTSGHVEEGVELGGGGGDCCVGGGGDCDGGGGDGGGGDGGGGDGGGGGDCDGGGGGGCGGDGGGDGGGGDGGGGEGGDGGGAGRSFGSFLRRVGGSD